MLRIGRSWRRAALVVLLATPVFGAGFSVLLVGCDEGAPDQTIVASPLIEAGAEDGGPRCKGTKGPAAIRVGDYCVDATEVSVSQYREFLSAKFGDMSGQPPECHWNTTYAAKIDQRDPENPVYGADWCDAFMYCQWAGKRLCGLAGGGGNVPSEARATSADEWYRACTGDDAHVFPYGDTHDERVCTGSGSEAPTRVGGKRRCEGGFPGVFDMSGNLWEWESSCEDGGADGQVACAVRGGSFRTEDRGACKDTLEVRRDLAEGGNDVTIRCCSDLQVP